MAINADIKTLPVCINPEYSSHEINGKSVKISLSLWTWLSLSTIRTDTIEFVK